MLNFIATKVVLATYRTLCNVYAGTLGAYAGVARLGDWGHASYYSLHLGAWLNVCFITLFADACCLNAKAPLNNHTI